MSRFRGNTRLRASFFTVVVVVVVLAIVTRKSKVLEAVYYFFWDNIIRNIIGVIEPEVEN